MTSPENTAKDGAPQPPDENAAAAPESPKEAGPQDETARLKEENARLRDQWIRAVAETDNVRKRSQRDLEETARYAIIPFARDMAGVLENLKRACDNIPSGAREKDVLLNTLGEGVDLTLTELLNVFEKYGIKRIDPVNEKFDPNVHQAVAQIERGDMPPGIVVQVIQAGYSIGNRLIQPAMVAVSKQAEAPKKVDETA